MSHSPHQVTFWKYIFFGTKCSNFFFNSNYIALHPRPQEVPEPENTQICMCACICVFHVFSGSGTSRGLWSNPKAVLLIKCYIITVLNFLSERFGPKNSAPKNGFSMVFSKSDLGGRNSFFADIVFWKSQGTRNMPKFSGNMSKT